jgi:hypothetical protein
MIFLLKQHCICLGNNKFETSFEDIKMIFDITVGLEKLLIDTVSNL